jgi:protein O-GlcNAc transferase
VNLGNALKSLGRLDEAGDSYLAAIRLKPDYAGAHANLGAVLRDKRQLDQSIAAYCQAIALKPDLALAHSNLANVLVEVGLFDEARAAYRQAMSLKENYPTAHSNLILLLLFSPGIDAVMISNELRRWNEQHAEPLKKSIVSHSRDRDPDRRLRIGYVSPDFRDHVIGRNVLPLIREHNHQAFEIFCYGDVARPDGITAQFQSRCDQWRSTVGVSNSRLAEMIRRDEIDILVDLSLHLGNNRLVLFAHKPAPVQVTFAGYPGSTGLEAIDYRLSDPYLDPPGENDALYREKTIRLVHSFWCYDPATADFPVPPQPLQSNKFITFGCLNNFAKVNQGMIELWSEVLKAVDRSRLILLCPEGSARQSLLEKFRAEGIDPHRIAFTGNLPRPKYFEMYHQIDIGLDTVPYNGHTTSLDALWMGVPVVTLVGSTVVGRGGLSQLTNLGLTELIARTPQEYVRIAAALASNSSHLAELHQTLRPRMLASPLTDARGFAREIENAFRQMWRSLET